MGIETLTQIDWVAFFKLASPLVILLGTSGVCLTGAALVRNNGSNLFGFVALTGLVASFVLAWCLWPISQDPQPTMMLIFNRVSVLSWLVLGVAGAFAIAMALPYLSNVQAGRPDFFALVLFAVFGMGVLSGGTDLITILLGLEVMSVAAYTLTGFLKTQEKSIEGAIKYFLMGAFATAFFAMGIAFLFGSTGTTDLYVMAERAKDVAMGVGRPFFLFGCAMVVIGFSFKVALVPFHAWAPDAYDGAPTPVTSLMATGIKAAAFIAFTRFVFAAPSHAGVLWHHLAWGLAFATMMGGNLAAIHQDNLKRMLAYSSIAHAGYILVVFPSIASNPRGTSAAVLIYIIAYVLMTAGAFASVIAVELECKGRTDIGAFAGLAHRHPFLSAVFTVFLVSLAGFPPTLGFFGKYYLFLTAVKGGDIALVCVAVIASVVSVYYYLRPVVVMYFRESKGEVTQTTPIPAAIVAILAITAMAVIIFGIMPQNMVAFVHGTVF